VAAACRIFEQMAVAPEARIAVVGDGRMGLLVAQVLRTVAADVTVLGRHEHKLAVARRLGLQTQQSDASQPAGSRFDVVVDVTGRPEGLRRSLELGEIVPVGPNPPPTLCDAIQTLKVSPITFGILHARGTKGLAVSEDETKAAVRWAWQEHGLVVEPGAAVSLAALLAGKAEIVPETVALLSGGNIDPELHAKLIA